MNFLVAMMLLGIFFLAGTLPFGKPSRKRATALLLKRLERLQKEVSQLEREE